MQQFTQITEIKEYLRKQQSGGARIGLVPTMGYLHEGHLSLIRRAVRENDITVVSIFVNPIQFGPSEDLAKYPRDLANDLQLIQETGAAVVFIPSTNEMYGEDYQTYVQVEKITKTLCGRSRPSHFQGVTTVVTKLFNIVRPDRAYFGQKDAQQAFVIKKMMQDLNMDVEIIVCPIVRETDNLAMSSRNVYLNVEERQQAVVLYQALTVAENLIQQKEKDALIVKEHMTELIRSKSLANIDYIAIVNAQSLQDIRNISGAVLIALAVKFGTTRLIDNIYLAGE
jgi:pantoate--beta-alanine ligase